MCIRVLGPSSYQDPSPVGLGPTLVIPLPYLFLLEAPSPIQPHSEGWASGYPFMNLEAGRHRSAQTNLMKEQFAEAQL